jgi:hypothetical protein
MMEAVRTSETSVNNYFTWQYIPEDNFELHTRRRENSNSHIVVFGLWHRVSNPVKPYILSIKRTSKQPKTGNQ